MGLLDVREHGDMTTLETWESDANLDTATRSYDPDIGTSVWAILDGSLHYLFTNVRGTRTQRLTSLFAEMNVGAPERTIGRTSVWR